MFISNKHQMSLNCYATICIKQLVKYLLLKLFNKYFTVICQLWGTPFTTLIDIIYIVEHDKSGYNII